jgi:hypothetical protein
MEPLRGRVAGGFVFGWLGGLRGCAGEAATIFLRNFDNFRYANFHSKFI